MLVEGGVIHNDDGWLLKLRQQKLLHPRVEHGGVHRARQQQRRQQRFAKLGRDEAGSGPTVAADFAVSTRSLEAPSMGAWGVFLKGRFIQIHQRLVFEFVPFLEVGLAFVYTYLAEPPRFF